MLGKRRMHHVIKFEITSPNWISLKYVSNIIHKADRFGGILLKSDAPQLKDGEHFGTTVRIAFRTKIQRELFLFFAEDSIRQLK